MAFTFDHTLGGANSNSYVPLDSYTTGSPARTVLGANDYFDGHPKQTLWTALTDEQKQQLLVRATVRLDAENYGGNATTDGQRLQFPRAWLVARDHRTDNVEFTNGQYYQSSDYLPTQMEHAVMELALFYLEEWIEESPLVSRSDMSRMTSMEIGPIKAQLRKAYEDELPDTVRRLLKAIGPNGWKGAQPLKVVR